LIGKEAGQYFLENGSCSGTSAKEKNLHNFQHPADKGLRVRKSLAFVYLKNTAANDTQQMYRANSSIETAAYST